MPFSMTGQEKGDLLIQATVWYRWPHGHAWLYIRSSL